MTLKKYIQQTSRRHIAGLNVSCRFLTKLAQSSDEFKIRLFYQTLHVTCLKRAYDYWHKAWSFLFTPWSHAVEKAGILQSCARTGLGTILSMGLELIRVLNPAGQVTCGERAYDYWHEALSFLIVLWSNTVATA